MPARPSQDIKWLRYVVAFLFLLVLVPLLFYGMLAMRAKVRGQRNRIVTAVYQIDREPPYVMTTNRQLFSVAEFKKFKSKQIALVKSDEVLQQSFQSIRDLPLVQYKTDAVTWLKEQIKVKADDGSEILTISMIVGPSTLR